MAGPAYQYDPVLARQPGSTAWPAYYDNIPLFYEWTRDCINAFRTSNGDVVSIEDVLASFDFDNPMDLESGPDGVSRAPGAGRAPGRSGRDP